MIRDIVDELYRYRGRGSTTVCASAARETGAVLVVQNEEEQRRLRSEFGLGLETVTLHGLARGKLRGRMNPLIFDPHTAAAMYSSEMEKAHQATRRRLLVKLCRERARKLDAHLPEARSRYRSEECGPEVPNRLWSNSEWCFRMASALESNQPLTYFQRLGEGK